MALEQEARIRKLRRQLADLVAERRAQEREAEFTRREITAITARLAEAEHGPIVAPPPPGAAAGDSDDNGSTPRGS